MKFLSQSVSGASIFKIKMLQEQNSNLGCVVNVDDPLTQATFSNADEMIQLLDPMQNPELTGDTLSRPKMSFYSTIFENMSGYFTCEKLLLNIILDSCYRTRIMTPGQPHLPKTKALDGKILQKWNPWPVTETQNTQVKLINHLSRDLDLYNSRF